MTTLALTTNRDEMVIQAEIDLSKSGRKYTIVPLRKPKFLREYWKATLATSKR